MIVKVEVTGSHVSICNKDGSMRMTTSATSALLARMCGRSVAFFDAKVERGGGKKKWDNEDKEVEYTNPTETVELDAALPDQKW